MEYSDRKLYQICSDVLTRVHAGFTYVSDEENYGLSEHWGFPDDVDNFQDDCDGFAIACRMLLKEKGIKCRLVACTVGDYGWHAVCAVGNYILENRYRRVMTKEELERPPHNYTFRYISGFEPGDAWRELDY